MPLSDGERADGYMTEYPAACPPGLLAWNDAGRTRVTAPHPRSQAKAPDDAALRTRWEASQKMHGCLVKLAAALRIEIKVCVKRRAVARGAWVGC